MSEAVNTSDTPKLDPIAAAIAKAKRAAEESVETQGENVPATQTQTGSAPAPATLPAGRPPALTMDDMKAGNITVDGWIGVKEFGFIFGPEKTLYPEMLTVQIDLTAVAICFAIKAGNPELARAQATQHLTNTNRRAVNVDLRSANYGIDSMVGEEETSWVLKTPAAKTRTKVRLPGARRPKALPRVRKT